jgi:hypothetical protein
MAEILVKIAEKLVKVLNTLAYRSPSMIVSGSGHRMQCRAAMLGARRTVPAASATPPTKFAPTPRRVKGYLHGTTKFGQATQNLPDYKN